MSIPCARPMGGILAALSVVVLAAAATLGQTAPPAAEKDVQTYRSHIEFLANPFMEGRGPGTRGNEIAAEYVETWFERFGLAPSITMQDFERSQHREGEHQYSFRQEFKAGTGARNVVSRLGVNLDTKLALDLATKYRVLGFSGSGSVAGPLVFVGYGIQKGGPDKSYNTFADTDDLTGKIAVLLRFEPMDGAGHSLWKTAMDSTWSPAAALPEKVRAAVDHHAAGLILVAPPGTDDPRLKKLPDTEDSARWMQPLDIPAIVMDAAEAEALVRWADPKANLADLCRAADKQGGIVPLGEKPVELRTQIDRVPRTTWNIAATLPGRGQLASQYIIIGAHYDHVGYGYTGGSRSDEYGIVHPGADDNASGASGLLLAAEMMKRRYDAAPKDANLRSIMFVAFSAEEMGLIGSREFMKASPLEAKQIDAMLNMDMIGRLRDSKLEISGTGTAEGFANLLKPIFDSSGLVIQSSPGGRGPSDHATFYGAGIPVLHFYTGMHEQYHTPRDTVDLINCEGAVKVVTLVCTIADTLAQREQQLAFVSTDKKKGEPEDGKPAISLGNVKVRFGIAPGNYADGEAGVLVGEVYPGTCAGEAGIQPGDRLIRWNGKEIGDVQSWMGFLSQHKPGDTVDVDVKRKGEEVRVRVTLKSRDQSPK
jgi:hypothetical protein